MEGGPTARTMTTASTPPDSTTAEMDAALADLQAHATEWAQRSLSHKIEMLEGLPPRIADVAGRWVTAASRAKGLAVGSPLRGEEWTSGPWALANYIAPLAETLRHIEAGTVAEALADRIRQREDGQTVVRVMPDGLYDRVLLAGMTAEVWMQPDVTPEALDRVKSKDIPGFGELFRMLSYETIGTSTIQSRACAVLARGTYIFALPGSNGAVRDGWDMILAEQLDSRNRPCNFVELMPRLRER